jgi:hypothetical protein
MGRTIKYNWRFDKVKASPKNLEGKSSIREAQIRKTGSSETGFFARNITTIIVPIPELDFRKTETLGVSYSRSRN